MLPKRGLVFALCFDAEWPAAAAATPPKSGSASYKSEPYLVLCGTDFIGRVA